jgi:hypothetical protein
VPSPDADQRQPFFAEGTVMAAGKVQETGDAGSRAWRFEASKLANLLAGQSGISSMLSFAPHQGASPATNSYRIGGFGGDALQAYSKPSDRCPRRRHASFRRTNIAPCGVAAAGRIPYRFVAPGVGAQTGDH